MIGLLRPRIAILLFVLLSSVGALCSIALVHGSGNELSNVDRFSEANALREVHNFLEQGVTRHYGLGDVYHPGLYPEDGFARGTENAKESVTPEGVYTHYPPGPEYLLFASMKLLGPEPVSRLRGLPIAIGWLATIFLGFTVRRRFGAGPAWLVMGAIVFAPACTDGFTGLHYQGYALALLMIEIGIAIGERAMLAAFAILGFLQGWLSFDYFFLVTVTPLALELAMPRIDPEYKPRWKLAFTRGALAGIGFAAAHSVHFLQVWGYWGSLDAAMRDIGGAAAHRADAGTTGYLRQALGNLKTYFYGLHPLHFGLSLPDGADIQEWSMFRFLGLSLGPWWLLATLAMIIWDHLDPDRYIGALRKDWHFVSAIGILTASLWLLTMVNHGGMHRHFLYRHLFVAFFMMTLFCAVRVYRLAFQSASSQSGLNRFGLDMASILSRSRLRPGETQETGHEIRHLL
jgi:hypothetical protein